MRRLATRWLTDRVRLENVTVGPATRDQPGGVETVSDSQTVAALVRQPSVVPVDGEGTQRSQRTLSVWVDDDATPAAGWRCTVVQSQDSSLQSRVGEVIGVERDSVRAVRRIDVRLSDD